MLILLYSHKLYSHKLTSHKLTSHKLTSHKLTSVIKQDKSVLLIFSLFFSLFSDHATGNNVHNFRYPTQSSCFYFFTASLIHFIKTIVTKYQYFKIESSYPI